MQRSAAERAKAKRRRWPSQARIPVARTQASQLHEVWWTVGDNIELAARFRLLADALRFVWGNNRQETTWLKLKDGSWEHASAFASTQANIEDRRSSIICPPLPQAISKDA